MNEQTKLFIENLKKQDGVLGVVLFGSWARGNNRPDSDIDLLVVSKTDTKREVERKDGQTFEIVYATEKDAASFYKDNRDSCVRFWEIAKIIFDKEGAVERIKNVAEKIKEEGKKPIEASKLKHFEFDATDQLRAVESMLTVDPYSANILLSEKILNLTSLYFDIKQLWTPAPKQLLAEIKGLNQELHNKLVSFYTDGNTLKERLIIAKEIIRLLPKNYHSIEK